MADVPQSGRRFAWGRARDFLSGWMSGLAREQGPPFRLLTGFQRYSILIAAVAYFIGWMLVIDDETAALLAFNPATSVFATCEGILIKPFDENDLMRTTMKCPSSGPLRSFATLSAIDPAASTATFQMEDGAIVTRRVIDAALLAKFAPGQKVWLSSIVWIWPRVPIPSRRCTYSPSTPRSRAAPPPCRHRARTDDLRYRASAASGGARGRRRSLPRNPRRHGA